MEMISQKNDSTGTAGCGQWLVWPLANASPRSVGLALLAGGFSVTGPALPAYAYSHHLGLPSSSGAMIIRLAGETRPETPAARPVAEQASLVVNGLGLNKSQVAEIFGISRPTIYAWLDGSTSQLQEPNAGKLQMLSQLAARICQDDNRPLFHGYVTRPMEGETQSLLELLAKPEWSEPQLARLLAKARSLTAERDARLEKLKPQILPSPEQQRKNLEHNLAALGAKN